MEIRSGKNAKGRIGKVREGDRVRKRGESNVEEKEQRKEDKKEKQF